MKLSLLEYTITKEQFETVRNFLNEEIPPLSSSGCIPASKVFPILHNKDTIILQFCGWSINLHSDGTFGWEDTTGG